METLYFAANDGIHGRELWRGRSDGTIELVADINPGLANSFPGGFAAFKGEMYFAATTATGGNELWKLARDGNVVQVADIEPGVGAAGLSNPGGFLEFNGELYFSATTSANGFELWKVDSTGVAIPVVDLPAAFGTPRYVLNGALYVATDVGTWRVEPNGTATLATSALISEGVIFNGELYFPGPDQLLQKINAGGAVVPVAGSPAIPSALVVFDDALVFVARDPLTLRRDIWKLEPDGSVVKATNIQAVSILSLTAFNDELYFVADTGSAGRTSLWKIGEDGIAAQVAVFNSPFPFNFTEFNGELYFQAATTASGVELWKVRSDGVTVLAADIAPGGAHSFPERFTIFNGEMYFRAFTAANGFELWKVKADGAVVLAADIAPGSAGSDLFNFFAFDANLPPAFDSETAAVTITENATAVTTVAAADPDAGQTLSYSIAGGADAALFAIDANTGALSLVSAPNFEAPADAGANNIYEVTVQVDDGAGGTDTQTISVTVTNENELPVVLGVTTGVVSEDSGAGATAAGQLSATDPDAGTNLTWSIDGGTTIGSASYHFGLDNLTITRTAGANTATVLDDTFEDGNPPPAIAGTLNPPNNVTYNVTGSITEAGGRAIFDATGAAPIPSVGTADPFVGHGLTVLTSADPVGSGGLRNNTSFTVEGRFDLALPNDPREAYGIRLGDRTAALAGDDVVDLVVRMGIDGKVRVQLRDVDYVNDTTTILGNVLLEPPVGTTQIVLRLTHSAGNVGVVTASFTYLGGASPTTHVLEATGRIYGIGTPGTGDDETWTRASVITFAPEMTDSALAGEYGTLNINQAGLWTYTLANGQANVQALAAGETVNDTFSVRASDGAGGVTTQTVSVAVTGLNDAPTVANTIADQTAEQGAPFSLTVPANTFADIDAGDSRTLSAALAGGGPLPDWLQFNTATGQFSGTPGAGDAGTYAITVRATDASGTFASDTFTLAVEGEPLNTAPSFTAGGDGIATTPIGSGNDLGMDAVLQPDGKVIVAGTASNGSKTDFALARYGTDGTLDLSFGVGGKLTTPFGTGNDSVSKIVLQADGKIVVGGRSTVGSGGEGEFAIIRYNSDGTIDTAFGTNGRVVTTFAADSAIQALALQPDGKILAGGYSLSSSTGYRFTLTRFDSDGNPDPTFSGDGIAFAPFNSSGVRALAVQPNGKIVAAGFGITSNGNDFALARFNADGTLDASFGSGGTVTTALAGGLLTDAVQSIALIADGKILVAGYTGSSQDGTLPNDIALARYNADGSLDTTFSGDGLLRTAIGAGEDFAASVKVLTDGKLLVAGHSFNGTSNDFVVVRYNADGSLDTSFSGDGVLHTPVGTGSDIATSLIVLPDGRFVVAGYTRNGTTDDFALVRYNADGSLDSTFDGISTLDDAPAFVENGPAVVLDADVAVFDPQLSALNDGLGNYGGATLTITRAGGAIADDVFSVSGPGSLGVGAQILPGGAQVTVTQNAGGVLALIFANGTTQAQINAALSAIRYANASDAPPPSVTLDWVLGDGNAGAQGAGGALAATGSITVSITAANDAPIIATDGGTQSEPAFSVAENFTGVVGTLAGTDPDLDNPALTWSLGPNGAPSYDNEAFTIDPVTGLLSLVAPQDFETGGAGGDNLLRVQVILSDGTASSSRDVFVRVTDVVEIPPNTAPVITSSATALVAENTTAVTTVTVDDPDAGQSHTYKIAGGADAAKFQIDAATGALSFVAPPDFERPGDVNGDNVYDVIVRASDGEGGTDTQAIAVTVTDQDDAPAVPLTVFVGTDPVNGRELWISDGTEAGTVLLKDIYPGGNGSEPSNFHAFGNRIVFQAGTPDNGYELWVTDGTAAGTNLLVDLVPGLDSSHPGQFMELGGKLLFTTVTVAGRTLWSTDGTAEGTVPLMDVSSDANLQFASLSGKLIFAATNAQHGTELWASDGTAAGTSLLKDIHTGFPPGANPAASSQPTEFIVLGNKVLFQANDGVTGSELWATDGTAEGTVLLANIYNVGNGGSGPQQFIRLGDKVVFTAIGPFVDDELWVTDGTTEGTILLKDIWPGAGGASHPSQFTVLGNLLVFTATDPLNGTEVWATDGTPDGTRLLKDINPGGDHSQATFFTAVNGKMVFQANDGTNGAELWVTDGTPDGTELLKDINPSGGSLPGKFAVLGNKVVFTATTVESGTELWVTDGTSAGTALLKDVVAGAGSSMPTNLQVVGGNVLFTVTLPGGIQQLWTTNGTPEGTLLLPNAGSAGLGGSGVFELPDHAPTVSVAIPDQAAAEGSPFSLTVASGTFSDIDAGDRPVLTASGLPAWLQFDSATGTFTGTPGSADSGPYDITVIATDRAGVHVADTFRIDVTSNTNAPPVAGNGVVDTDEDTQVTFDPLTFAFDPDGDPLVVTDISTQSGVAVLNADGTITYTPVENFNGSDALTYTVSDGRGGTDTASIEIGIAPVNDAPVLANVIPDQAASEGAAFSFTVPGNTFADVDSVDGDTLTLTATGMPAWLEFDAATGTFSGTPGFSHAGTYSVTVTAMDAAGVLGSDQFDIVVANTNRAPVAGPGAASTFEDTQFTFDARVFAGDPDGDPLTVTAVSTQSGSAVINTDGTITYTPVANFNGSDSLTYTVSDERGGTDTASIEIGIAPVNDAPTVASAIADQAVTEGAAFAFTVPAQTFADADSVDGDTLSFTVAGMPAWLNFDPLTGTLSGTSGFDAAGSYDITVTATDESAASVSDTFTLTVNEGTPVNTAPDLGPPTAAAAVAENTTLVQVLAATDPDVGQTLTYEIVPGGDGALFEIRNSNELHFVNAPDFEGPADAGANNVYDVTVRVSDGAGGEGTQAIAVSVTGVNEAPTAIADSVGSIPAGFTVNPANGHFYRFVGGGSIWDQAAQAAATAGGYLATITSAQENAFVTGLLPSNSFFNWIGGSDRTLEGTWRWTQGPETGTIFWIGLQNGTPVGGQYNNWPPTEPNQANDEDWLTIRPDGLWNDLGLQQTASGYVIEIGGRAQDGIVTEDTSADIAVLANDTDPDAGDTLSVSAHDATSALGAAISAGPNGTLRYDPTASLQMQALAGGQIATDTFSYTVRDAGGLTSSATVTMRLIGINDAPTASAVADQSAQAGSGYSFTLPVGTFADVDTGDSLTLTATLPSWLQFNPATGTFSGNPQVADVGTHQVTVTATDALGASVSDTFTVAVAPPQPVNTAPDLGPPTAVAAVAENTTLVRVLDAINPDAGQTLTYEVAPGGADAGLFEIRGNELHFTTAPDFENPGSSDGDNIYDVTVRVSDGAGGVDVQTIAVTVTDVAGVTLEGTPGNDAGATALVGTPENDNISGLDGDDEIFGGDGRDFIWGGAGADTLDGGDGNDFLIGDSGDRISGGNGNDSFSIAEQPLSVDGGAGDDNLDINGNGSGKIIFSDANASGIETFSVSRSDTVLDLSGLSQPARAIANNPRVTLIGTAGSDLLVASRGGGFDVTLEGGAGADTLLAQGSGPVTASYASSGFAVLVDLAAGTASGGDADGDTLINITGLTGSALGDTLLGNDRANFLTGGAGADILDGREGFDRASYGTASAGVTVDLMAAVQSGGDAEGDTLLGIEALVGSAFDDVLSGDDNLNSIVGGLGADVISGRGGNDQIEAADGDTVFGGEGSDTITILGVPAGVDGGSDPNGGDFDVLRVIAHGTLTNISNIERFELHYSGGTVDFSQLTGPANIAVANHLITVLGTDHGDAIVATFTNDNNFGSTIDGRGGNDAIAGGIAPDTMTGGAGDDIIDGGAKSDTAFYSGNRTDYSVERSTGGGFVITDTREGSPDGRDVVTNVELFQFADALLSEAEVTAQVAIDKTVAGVIDRDGGNGGAAVDEVGDSINYRIEVRNTGDVAITGVTVSDPMLADLAYAGGDADDDSALDVNEVWTYTGSYAVAQEDLDNNGTFDNRFSSDTDFVPQVFDEVFNAFELGVDRDGGLTFEAASIFKRIATTQAAVVNLGVVFNVGGAAQVSGSDNPGDTRFLHLTETELQAAIDWMGGGSIGPSPLLPLLTDSGGDIHNVATADSDQTGPVSDDASVPVAQSKALVLDKSADVASVDSADDLITYTYTLTNAGNAAISGIVLSDDNATPGDTGDDFAPERVGGDSDGDERLDVGETWVYRATRIASAAQIAAGLAIVNTATATGIGAANVTDTAVVDVETANSAPTDIALAGATVVENAVNGTLIGTLTGTDADGGALTFALIDSAGGRFNIANGNQLVVNDGTLLDFDTSQTHVIAVQVTDSGGLSYTESFTIGLQNVAGITQTGNGSANTFTGTGEEDTLNGGAGNDTLRGLGGNDILIGGGGSDTLEGGAGDDALDGGSGADAMSGGAGDDTYILDNAGDTVNEAEGEGNDTVRTSLTGHVLAAHVENLTLTGSGNLSGTGNGLANLLTGNGGNNALSGGAGNDTLDGGAGNDTLDGGIGDDTMIGGTGNDTYVVDSLGDVVAEASGGGTDLVRTTLAAYTLDENVENLAFTGAGNFAGTGNGAANTITGGSGNDTLLGLAGNDTLIGGAGNDRLDGGSGNDTMTGGAGDDTYVIDSTGDDVNESSGGGIDTFEASVSYSLSGNIENLTQTGTGNIAGSGNSLANVITGNAGNNTIDGNGGSDTLIGGAGNDILIGGGGSDTFVFRPGFGNDRITDFDANPNGGQDHIDITAFGIASAVEFAQRVAITDIGAHTLVTIDGDPNQTIRLDGFTSITTVTVDDFRFL